jgi:hypothetical protein
MYGAFWTIYWQYWADKREEDEKRRNDWAVMNIEQTAEITTVYI